MLPSGLRVALGLTLAALPSVLAVTHTVTVGAGGLLAYDPPYISAHPGDVVNFIFHPKNHTVTQSAFDPPCVPLHGGFSSGFVPVASEYDVVSYPVFVPDSSPIWVHCEQTGHCGKGMVFAINAPPDPSPHSFSAFKALAIKENGTTTTAPPASKETYSSKKPTTHKITVGADGKLAFNPSNITAAVGDKVSFEFHPKNHTVTQSSFADPCRRLADTSKTYEVGFDSGFNPVAATATYFPTFEITVKDTKPIWGYCRQTGHCGMGMVFSINAVESDPAHNFAAFQALAKKTNGTAPPAYAPAKGKSAALIDADSSSSSGDSKISTYGPIVLGLLGANVLIGLVLVALGVLLYLRRSGKAGATKAAYVPVKLAEEPPPVGSYETRYSD